MALALILRSGASAEMLLVQGMDIWLYGSLFNPVQAWGGGKGSVLMYLIYCSTTIA